MENFNLFKQRMTILKAFTLDSILWTYKDLEHTFLRIDGDMIKTTFTFSTKAINQDDAVFSIPNEYIYNIDCEGKMSLHAQLEQIILKNKLVDLMVEYCYAGKKSRQ